MEALSASDLIKLGRSNGVFRNLVIGAMAKMAGDDKNDKSGESQNLWLEGTKDA